MMYFIIVTIHPQLVAKRVGGQINHKTSTAGVKSQLFTSIKSQYNPELFLPSTFHSFIFFTSSVSLSEILSYSSALYSRLTFLFFPKPYLLELLLVDGCAQEYSAKAGVKNR